MSVTAAEFKVVFKRHSLISNLTLLTVSTTQTCSVTNPIFNKSLHCQTTSIDSIRKNTFESLKFEFADKKVSKDIIINLIDIANDLSNGVLIKISALKKVINTLTEDMDPKVAKLLQCFKALVETLPSNTQQKKVKEQELCTRYLQPFFQSLFDSIEDDNMLFNGPTQ